VSARTERRLHLVASSGGHLELLAAISSVLELYELVWVTPDSNRARALEQRGDRLETIPFYGRKPLKLLRHLARVVPLLVRERPRVVVTSGAGPAVPFCVLARMAGARIVFVETMARVTNASISGRILSRVAHRSMVQWPEMLEVYRKAELCHPALLSEVQSIRTPTGVGVFAAVGTHVQGFDRLLSTLDAALDEGVIAGPATAQSGVSHYDARSILLTPFMAPEAMHRAMTDARYVICHAGSGMISTALRTGHRPIVMPRLRRYGEHVDDHQLQIVEKLAEAGLVVPLEGNLTRAHLAAADEPLDPMHLDAQPGGVREIPDALVAALAELDPTGGLPSEPPRSASAEVRTYLNR
jgi:UDP-N-acetylglucosamine--N-acetylmuramyl-(pentapeptide) pyrophosphoryl-undecaprenol N-acetylglucosamine transferase